jgi:hypothetical protein
MQHVKEWMSEHLHEHVDSIDNTPVAWSLAAEAIREFRPDPEWAFAFFEIATEVVKEGQ